MSLNGLDSPEVQAAYQTAAAEAAGWFLLQYVSRDGVELLARGRNGVSEARNAITAYTQPSPLYGLMMYRRRRLLIKYIPEGTSRLLQARTSVHFQDILERYSPYETLLEITTSEGLNDTALAKNFPLHTASPSPSPSLGRLDEITEDGEDGGAEVGSLPSANVSSTTLTAAQRYKAARRGENLTKRTERAERSAASLQVSGGTPPSLSPRLMPAMANTNTPSKPLTAQPLVEESLGSSTIADAEPKVDSTSSNVVLEAEQTVEPLSTPDQLHAAAERLNDIPVQQTTTADIPEETSSVVPAPSHTVDSPTSPSELSQISHGGDAEVRLSEDPAVSEATPSIREVSMDDDPYDLSKYDKYFKPKVKLGPRPVTAAEKVTRPGTARVSAVPASFRNARKQESLRSESQGKDDTTSPAYAPAQFDPAVRVPPPIPIEYSPRPYSRGSVKSAPSHRSTAMTPDRLRLMKAVELRKRQLRKSQEPTAFTPPAEEEQPEMPSLLIHTASEPPKTPVNQVTEDRDGEAEQSNTDDEGNAQSTKADSGIEIRYDTPSVDDLDERAPPLPEDTVVHHSEPNGTIEESVPVLATMANETIQTEAPSDATAIASLEDDSPSTEQIATPEEEADVELAVSAPPPEIELADTSRPPSSDGTAHIESSGLSHVPSSDTLRSAEPISRPESSEFSRRRRGLVEPLQLAMPSGNPDDFMSDDEFLEELHSATVQEARPILYAHQPSMEDISTVRSVSITRNLSGRQSSAEHLSPESSPALLNTSPSEKADSAWNAPRKVSSGISKRIQALNQVSTREAHAIGQNRPSSPLTPESTNNTFLNRDNKSRAPRRAPSPAARLVSFRRPSKPGSASQTPVKSPPIEHPPTWSVQHDPLTSRSSVSVTARIVRTRTEPDQARLVQSELTINRDRIPTSKSNLDLAPIDVDAAQQSNLSSPALSPSSRGSAETRTLHSASGRFGRRGKSGVTSPATPEILDFPAPPNQRASTASINTENSTSKRGTRTSRFFKRVSTLSGPKRRRSAHSMKDSASIMSLDSGAGTKTASRVSVATHHSDSPPAVVVGDLNVQFPDSLLWKRRIVTINEYGELQFAIAQAMEIHKGIALKSFALSGFSTPYAPDLDRQELANSIMLELQDGTTLQLACEDSMTQRQVLHLLKSYWKAWVL